MTDFQNLGLLFGFYGISTFVGYLMPNPFLYKYQARVDLGAMAMKGYSTFPKAPALLEPPHQTVYCHIQDSRWGGLTPLQRCNRYILQPLLTGQELEFSIISGHSFAENAVGIF